METLEAIIERINEHELKLTRLDARFPGIFDYLAICPDPTGEGSAWQGNSVGFRIPTGWTRLSDSADLRTLRVVHLERNYHGVFIVPDPSIPWGEGYEAILPEEAREGDEFRDDYRDRQWVVCKDKGAFNDRFISSIPWRRRKSRAEPAPGSDAEHPPEGYRLEPVGGKRAPGYAYWNRSDNKWEEQEAPLVGVEIGELHPPIANPIPANEGDSQKAEESGEIQKKLDLQWEAAKALEHERNDLIAERVELCATVERLTAELDTTKRLLADSLVERDRLKNLHDARKVRIDGFREVLRERLGDLV